MSPGFEREALSTLEGDPYGERSDVFGNECSSGRIVRGSDFRFERRGATLIDVRLVNLSSANAVLSILERRASVSPSSEDDDCEARGKVVVSVSSAADDAHRVTNASGPQHNNGSTISFLVALSLRRRQIS